MQRWWGSWNIPPGQAHRWVVGPLELWIEGRPSEWRVAVADRPDALDRFVFEGPSQGLLPPEDARELRFATTLEDQRISIEPTPADRPIVVRPQPALSLPSSQSVTFYVSTPAWLELVAGTGGRLVNLPSTRLSDTWFGATTREGQLCYASRTAASLQLESLPLRPGRVRTEIRVRNQGPDPLLIERVQLPAPHLPLFVTRDNVLWTPSVTVVRKGSEPRAEVTVSNGPPAPVGPTERIASARVTGPPNIVVRALGALLAGD